MSELKDYSAEKEYTHYNGVKSMYGKIVDEQCRQQPNYCNPGMVDESGAMKGAHRNVQAGP